MASDVERWLPIPGYKGRYLVSSYGRVLSVGRIVQQRHRTCKIRDKLLKMVPCDSGHQQVTLHCDDGGKVRLVHHLVLETFVGPCPPGMQCRHLDGDPTNNSLDNLCWGTPAENTADMLRHGTDTRGGRNAKAKLYRADILGMHARYKAGDSTKTIAEKWGVSQSVAWDIIRGHSYQEWQPPPEERAVMRPAFAPSHINQGSKHGQAKLNEDLVRHMREEYDSGAATLKELALRHSHLHIETIRGVINRRTWKHVN